MRASAVVWAAVVAACWCAASAMLVCSNTTFCETVSCSGMEEENCPGEMRPNATLCGCCPACIRIYEVGANCPGYNTGDGLYRPGTRHIWECRAGSRCINNRCTIIETTSETLETEE